MVRGVVRPQQVKQRELLLEWARQAMGVGERRRHLPGGGLRHGRAAQRKLFCAMGCGSSVEPGTGDADSTPASSPRNNTTALTPSSAPIAIPPSHFSTIVPLCQANKLVKPLGLVAGPCLP